MLDSIEEAKKVYKHIKVEKDGTQRFMDDGTVTKEYRDMLKRIDKENVEIDGKHFIININDV